MKVTDDMVEAALDAFRIARPGVIRRVQQIDSYPGEHPDDPDAYNLLPCTFNDEKAALRDAIEAALSVA